MSLPSKPAGRRACIAFVAMALAASAAYAAIYADRPLWALACLALVAGGRVGLAHLALESMS